jgi:hypothetical protein
LGGPDFHEDLTRDEELVGSSDRLFGLTLAPVGAIVAVLKLWHGQSAGWIWLGAAAVFLILTLFCHAPLAVLNRVWMRFGLTHSRVLNPVVTALLFFVTKILGILAFSHDSAAAPIIQRRRLRSC